MRNMFNGLVIVAVCLFCINMGGGEEYSRSISGLELPKFMAEDRINVYQGEVIDENSKTMGYALCFHDPGDDDNYARDRKSVGQTYVDAFYVGKSGKTDIKFRRIVSLEVKGIAERNGTSYLEVVEKLKDEAGNVVENQLYLPTDISLGYREKSGKWFKTTTVFLRQIDRIENITRMEGIPGGLFEE